MQNQLGHLLEVKFGAKNENPNFVGLKVQARSPGLTLIEVVDPKIQENKEGFDEFTGDFLYTGDFFIYRHKYDGEAS